MMLDGNINYHSTLDIVWLLDVVVKLFIVTIQAQNENENSSRSHNFLYKA